MPPICFISSEGKEVYVKNGKTAALFSQVLRDAVSVWSTQYNEEDKYVNYNINSYIVGTETEKLLEERENKTQHEEIESQSEEQIDWNHHHYHYREYDEEIESEEEEEWEKEQVNEDVNTKKLEMEDSEVQIEYDDKVQENINVSHNNVTRDTINVETESSTVKPNYLIVRKSKHKKRRQHLSNKEKESESSCQRESPLEEEEEEEEEREKEEKTKLAGSIDTEINNRNKYIDETAHEQEEQKIQNSIDNNSNDANNNLSQMHKSRQRHRKGQSCKKMNYKNLQFVTTSSVIANEPYSNDKTVDGDVFVEEQKEVLEENKETPEEKLHSENELSAQLDNNMNANIDNAVIKTKEKSIHDEEQSKICTYNNISNNNFNNDSSGINNENEEEIMLDDKGELEEEEEERIEEGEEEHEEHDNSIEDEESEEVESDCSDNSCTLEELELMLEERNENEENSTPCFAKEKELDDHKTDHDDEDVQFIKSILTAPEYWNELPMKLQKLDKSLLEERLRQRRYSLHETHSLNSTKIISNSSVKNINTNIMRDDDKHQEIVCTTTLPSFANTMNATNININESQLFVRLHNTITTPSSPLSSNSSSLSSPLSALSTLSSSNSSTLNRRTSASSVKSASVIIKKLDENVADALYDSDNEEIDNNITENTNNVNFEEETNYINNTDNYVNEKRANHFSSSCMSAENNLTNMSSNKNNNNTESLRASSTSQTRHVDPFNLLEYANNNNNMEGEEMYNSHVTHDISYPEFNNGKAASENYDKESVEYLSSAPGLTSNMNYSTLSIENNNTHTLNEHKVNSNTVYENEYGSLTNDKSNDETNEEDDISMTLHAHIDGWNSMNTINNNNNSKYCCPCLSANDQPSHSELDNDDYLNWQSPRSFHQRTPCMIEMEDSPNAVRLLSSDGTEMILRTSYGHEGSVEKGEKQFNLSQDKYVNGTYGNYYNNNNSNNKNHNLESMNKESEEYIEQINNKDDTNMEEPCNIIITPPKMLTLYEEEKKEYQEEELVENIDVNNKENSNAQESKQGKEAQLGTENVTDLEFCHRRMNKSAIVFDFQQSEIHKSCNNTYKKKEQNEKPEEEEEEKCISEDVCKNISLNEVETKHEQQHETDIKYITNNVNVDQKLQKKCLPFSTHVLELCASFLNRLEENRLALEKSDALEKWKNIQWNESHSCDDDDDDDDQSKNNEEDNEDDDEESNDSFVNTTVKIKNVNSDNNNNNGLLMNGITAGLSSSTQLMHSMSNTHDNVTQRLLTPISATPLSSPLTAILLEWEIVYLYHDILCYSEHDIANLKWWTTLYPEFDFRCPALSIRMLKAQINKCKTTKKNNNNKATTNANNMCTSDSTIDKNKNDNNNNCVNGKVDDVDEGNNINKVSNSVSINCNNNCNKSNDILSFAQLPIRTPVPPQHGVQTLMTLMKLAQVLQITELYNLCTAWIADHMLRCAYFDDDCFASAQSIRAIFHIKNDYTSKERECLVIENEWPADES